MDDRPRQSQSAFGSACDSCKRRKVRCKGGQPCDRCASTGVSCTYGSSKGRTTAVSYTRYLEDRVAALEERLRQESGRGDEEGPSSRTMSEALQQPDLDLVETLVNPNDDFLYLNPSNSTQRFHGRYAGLSVLRRVRALCDSVSGSATNTAAGQDLVEAFDSLLLDPPMRTSFTTFAPLPDLERTRKLLEIALDEALCLQEYIDRVELWTSVQRLYTLDPSDLSRTEQKSLALLYALLAIGRRWEHHDEGAPSDTTNDARVKGFVALSVFAYTLMLITLFKVVILPRQSSFARDDRLQWKVPCYSIFRPSYPYANTTQT
jgi:hypothetical protein